ncbi:MAG: hypothetical protein WDW38_004158 [Sanguina aurantia]
MTVDVVTTSGRPGPVLAQQLAACTAQLKELLEGLTPAMANVTILTLRVRHEALTSSRVKASSSSAAPSPLVSCPASFAVITRTICTMLAAATPRLRSLRIEGCCRDAGLAAFGACCPEFNELELEVTTVPTAVLTDIDCLSPQLTTCKLTAPDSCTDGPQLTEYVGVFLQALQASTCIYILELRFNWQVVLQCQPTTWQHVPKSLRALMAFCAVQDIQLATTLLKNLNLIWIEHTTGVDVFEILRSAPNLEELYVYGSSKWSLRCDGASTASGVTLLRERMRTGFGVDAPNVDIWGANDSLRSVLTALPPLKCVQPAVSAG